MGSQDRLNFYEIYMILENDNDNSYKIELGFKIYNYRFSISLENICTTKYTRWNKLISNIFYHINTSISDSHLLLKYLWF
jgi:hypothetical protein